MNGARERERGVADPEGVRERRRQSDVRVYVVVIAAAIEAYYRIRHGVWVAWPVVLAVPVLAYFSLTPRAMRPVANALMRVVHRMGKVNNFLVLSVVFFAILAPIGMLMRWLKRDRIDLEARQPGESYWKARADRGKDIDFTKIH